MNLKELNAKIDRTPVDLAGVTMRPGYAVGRLGGRHKCSKVHIIFMNEVIDSSDPDIDVGSVVAFTLCDATREAAVYGSKNDLDDVDCEKCREALRKIKIAKRRAARRRTA